jgi:hypothetical protein
MSWNGNEDKDPWGRKDSPPDIDEAIKQFKAKINSIFGGGSGGSGGTGSSGGGFTKKKLLFFYCGDIPTLGRFRHLPGRTS